MFTSVRIQNFRQFRDLKLEGLGQINLITGANDTGKTSLLEALFLLAYPDDPTRTVTLANGRGVERLSPGTPELWEWLFRNREHWKEIEIKAENVDGGNAHLGIKMTRQGLLSANFDRRTGDLSEPIYRTESEPLPIPIYDRYRPGENPIQSVLRWTSQGLLVDPVRIEQNRVEKPAFLLSDRHSSSQLDADRLSRLEEVGREKALVEALQIIEPRLQRLTVLTYAGRPTVAADLGEYPLVPLALLGQGFGYLLTTLSAIILSNGAMVLIDEISAGYHYSALEMVWKAIIETAIKHDVQIFATTHSYECIEAAVKASEAHVGKLALFRLERHKSDIRAVTVEDEGVRAAVDFSLELR